jgi:hypothetical protein
MERDELEAVIRGDWKHTIEDKGGHCPICDRWGKINTIRMRGVMVKAMHWLAFANNGDWVNVPSVAPRFVTRSYAIASLKHWNMVERRYVPPPTKEEREAGLTRDTRTSGMWRLTQLGRDFIFNGAQAPKAVFVYNDHKVGESDVRITARDCAYEKFNYDAMMDESFNGDYSGLDYA